MASKRQVYVAANLREGIELTYRRVSTRQEKENLTLNPPGTSPGSKTLLQERDLVVFLNLPFSSRRRGRGMR
jgi:hypothetical protein